VESKFSIAKKEREIEKGTNKSHYLEGYATYYLVKMSPVSLVFLKGIQSNRKEDILLSVPPVVTSITGTQNQLPVLASLAKGGP
jgi:hypothetical protein